MEWRTIDSAPKEIVMKMGYSRYGEQVLLSDGHKVIRGRWWEMADTDERNFISDGGWAFHATHWMPMPEPPKQNGE